MIDVLISQGVGLVWGLPLVMLLASVGLFFTFYFKFLQFKGFKHALDVLKGKYKDDGDHESKGEVTHFQALSTALSGTVGLGNIAGVAVAVGAGGPGALFWMMLFGFFGMLTKFVECTLGHAYRETNKNGQIIGGPAQYLSKKFHPHLGKIYAVFCLGSVIGAANLFQINQMSQVVNISFGIPKYIVGIFTMTFVGLVVWGGVKSIAAITSKLVPLMGSLYVLGGLVVILFRINELPEVMTVIFQGAFSGTAAVGGFTGVAIMQVLRQGVQRAVFSNEAGLGTACIIHSASRSNESVRVGIIALIEPFVDTILICFITGCVIIFSGEWHNIDTYQGVSLTVAAFNSGFAGFGDYFIPVAVSLFAFSTMISWFYYGEIAVKFLFNKNYKIAFQTYRVIFLGAIIVGSVAKLQLVLNFSDMFFGMMAWINIIAISILAPEVKKMLKEYWSKYEN